MYNSYALNSFLTFRFVYDNTEWKKGLLPYSPKINNLEKYLVNGVLEALRISLILKKYLKVNLLVMESL